ncbi:MAG: hypothetical protein J7M06_05945 [Proteobacteria bacterium]|nr:hypothetical protein [Pseudomonadota bacterium]
MGAIDKSTQISLYTWFPDAMESPIPVCALINSTTVASRVKCRTGQPLPCIVE